MELPEDCIASILCRTTPADAARLAVVSKIFCSAADSDTVWDHFLPSDYHSIVSQFPYLAGSPSKKELYLALPDHPVIIDDYSFELDKKSGKKSYMLSARALSIVCGDDKYCWFWTKRSRSRFPEVAELMHVWWLEICGMISTLYLSPSTHYGAFFVYKIIDAKKVHDFPVELSAIIVGGHNITKNVYLNPDLLEDEVHNPVKGWQGPSVRRDGWLEIEMCEFFNSGLEDEEIQMSVMEINGYIKSSLIVEGIEVRPKKYN